MFITVVWVEIRDRPTYLDKWELGIGAFRYWTVFQFERSELLEWIHIDRFLSIH